LDGQKTKVFDHGREGAGAYLGTGCPYGSGMTEIGRQRDAGLASFAYGGLQVR
jgi:hypothetical protein